MYPYFNYCNHVWGCTYVTNLQPLVVLQKWCIRIISFAKYHEHTDPLFKKLNIIKFLDMNKYVFSRFMFRWYHDDIPVIFNRLFKRVEQVHSYGTRQSNLLYCNEINTNRGSSKLSYRGPFVWNKIIKSKINPDTSECVFVKSVQQSIKVGII